MKQTLLTVVALACSGVTQAEIYFCATNSTTLIFTNTGTGNIISQEPNGSERELNFVIDTEKGFRPMEVENSLYQGACEKS